MANEIDKALYEALDTLCEECIANRGSENAFFQGMHGKDIPWYWVRAEQALKRAKTIGLIDTEK